MTTKVSFNPSTEPGQPTEPSDYKESPAFKRLPKADQWSRMAANGDVRGLLDEIEHAHPGIINIKWMCQYVNQALDVLARTNPTALTKVLGDDCLAITGKLLVHAQFIVQQQLTDEAEDRQTRGAWFNPDKINSSFSHLMALHLHFAKLQQMAADKDFVVERTRKMKLANDKAEAKKNRPSRPARRRRLSTERQPPTTPASRITEGLI